MTIKEPLIKFKQVERATMPHYYDYGIALDQVTEILKEKISNELKLYSFTEGIEEFEDTIKHLLTAQSDDIELLGTVFDHIASSEIEYTDGEKYSIIPSLTNNIFYFSKFAVAITKLNIFQSHEDFEEEFIFAKNDASVLAFLEDMLTKQHEYMLEGIHVVTDTEDGLERTKEEITKQIPREDVLLSDDIKTDVFRSIDEFFNESGSFFKTYNIPYKRGILLYGSPGNGKTTLVKSIAGSVNAPVVYWQITEYTNSYSISEVFDLIKKMAPMILIIEDIDSMPEESRSVFLNTLDGATSKEGIFIIGTTNYPERIDPALINRAGRFDRAYEIKQPTDKLRYSYLTKLNLAQFLDVNSLERLTKMTKGLSIAQLNELYMSAALQWHYEKQVDIDKIVADLKENHKRTLKRNFETEEYGDPLGF